MAPFSALSPQQQNNPSLQGGSQSDGGGMLNEDEPPQGGGEPAHDPLTYLTLVGWRFAVREAVVGEQPPLFPDFSIVLIGTRADNGQPWSSSPVTEVIDSRVIRTATRVYKLLGPLARWECIYRARFPWPEWLILRFIDGFPAGVWRDLIIDYVVEVTTTIVETPETAAMIQEFLQKMRQRYPERFAIGEDEHVVAVVEESDGRLDDDGDKRFPDEEDSDEVVVLEGGDGLAPSKPKTILIGQRQLRGVLKTYDLDGPFIGSRRNPAPTELTNDVRQKEKAPPVKKRGNKNAAKAKEVAELSLSAMPDDVDGSQPLKTSTPAVAGGRMKPVVFAKNEVPQENPRGKKKRLNTQEAKQLLRLLNARNPRTDIAWAMVADQMGEGFTVEDCQRFAKKEGWRPRDLAAAVESGKNYREESSSDDDEEVLEESEDEDQNEGCGKKRRKTKKRNTKKRAPPKAPSPPAAKAIFTTLKRVQPQTNGQLVNDGQQPCSSTQMLQQQNGNQQMPPPSFAGGLWGNRQRQVTRHASSSQSNNDIVFLR